MTAPRVEGIVAGILSTSGLTLAVAESCTGGLLSHWITNVPGASRFFSGGLVAYSNELKIRYCGVNPTSLEVHGAVSAEVVLEMAVGVRIAFDSDLGLAISGIAGPNGGTAEKPVGLTWIGLSAKGYQQAWDYVWPGDRLAVKAQSAEKALRLLEAYLRQRSV